MTIQFEPFIDQQIEAFIREKLLSRLGGFYTPPATPPAYAMDHIVAMLAAGRSVYSHFTDKRDTYGAFAVAVVLHNSDRPYALEGRFKDATKGDDEWKVKWKEFLADILSDAPASLDKDVVIDAVLQHSKRDDELGDSFVLTSLRFADKVVRWGCLGTLGPVVNRCARGATIYDLIDPFRYCRPGDLTGGENPRGLTAFDDMFRVLEWVRMISVVMQPLIPWRDVKRSIDFARGVGEQIAEAAAIPDETEACLLKALGAEHYARFQKTA